MKQQGCYLCKSKNRSFLWSKNGFDILVCDSCKFTYVDPVPSKTQLNHFYSKFDYHDVSIAEKIIRKDAIRSLKRIEKYKNKGKLLDLGCGRGFFMDEARKRGWEVYGIDYSKKVIKYAREVLGLFAQQADIFTFKSKQKFDVVTLNQVIEHMSKPNELIRQSSKLLNTGGVIYLATPNISSIFARVAKEDFDYLIPPEHLGYYNHGTLSRLLESNSFQVLYSGSWGYRQDFAGIFKKLFGKNIKKAHSESMDIRATSLTELFLIKRIKYLLFDIIFCGLFYRILDFDHLGTNIEIIGVKL